MSYNRWSNGAENPYKFFRNFEKYFFELILGSME